MTMYDDPTSADPAPLDANTRIADEDVTAADDANGIPDQFIVSAVWKQQVLGLAFVQDTTLRFCQIADAAPEFRMLQSFKYAEKPSVIVAPLSSDPAWFAALSASSLQLPGAMRSSDAAAEEGDLAAAADDDPMAADAAGGGSSSSRCPQVVGLKNRDFAAEAAPKRLSLLRTLSDLPQTTMTERDIFIYLEHVVPRDQEIARCAIAGLLAYLSRAEVAGGASPVVHSLRRYALESHVYVSPETFLGLGIFADERHPSAHGGRGRDGFCVWSLMNRTRSKPGERVLKDWFARPTQCLRTLRERHDFIAFMTEPSRMELLPALHSAVSQMKDVTKLATSLARGGLLLNDFTAVLLTATSAVKAKELLAVAELPAELPALARAHAAISPELYTTANTVANMVDFHASAQASRLCPGAAKHISVKAGVHADLDALRAACDGLEPVLTHTASEERHRLCTFGYLPSNGDLYIVYVPQLGFLVKIHLAKIAQHLQALDLEGDERAMVDAVAGALAEGAQLYYQFDAEGELYFKGECTQALDEEYGDISSQIKDLECQLIAHLEERLLEQLPILRTAQIALSELDALLALASAARDLGLSQPTLTESDAGVISVQSAWHPLLQAASSTHSLGLGGRGGSCVPNDCEIGSEDERLMLLTGPNASGKTVYLRTVALVVYLAHVGSFVPAASASIARTDAILTRIHSKESAAVNQSAFMLDLSQMAHIFRHSTARTLCLIDEFGKGTNAHDGISLLYACLNELLSRGTACPRVLACTHFTEILDINNLRSQPGLALWTMQVLLRDKQSERDEEDGAADPSDRLVDDDAAMATGGGGLRDDEFDNGAVGSPPREVWHGDSIAATSSVLDDEVVFLYKAVRGSCTDSFGSHCATVANMPEEVIERARHVSRCRHEGRPIKRLDLDTDKAEAKERAISELVDAFLAFDFHSGSPSEFFASVDDVMFACQQD